MKITEIKPPPPPEPVYTVECTAVEIAYLYCCIWNAVTDPHGLDPRISRWAKRVGEAMSKAGIPNFDYAHNKPEPD